MTANPLRDLPSVDALLRTGAGEALVGEYGRQAVVATLRDVLAEARAAGEVPAQEGLLETTARRLGRPPSLRPVLNATGVIIHTNLGRAPLAEVAIERVGEVAAGYSTLEYDLAAGRRGSRHDHLSGLLSSLTGAAAGLAVNNNAAAVLLCLAATAGGGEVLISRGQLIEIGDGFRIPDILAQSGARLVEVGTTNRTGIADYRQAITSETRAILRVHQSNFRIVGFTAHPGLQELAEVAGGDVALIDDLGSGALLDLPDLLDEPTARASIEAGADLVCFSGDKLLGGPQAGIIVGTAEAVGRVKRHPLARAMRIDKLSLAALEAVLRLYLDPQRALREIPVLRMLAAGEEELSARAATMRDAIGRSARVIVASGKVGGGALPLLELEGPVCAVDPGSLGLDELARRLREHEPPVIARAREGWLLLDPRTLDDAEAHSAAAAVVSALGP
jgi:L-seryl-tRNA(Ser) seleniumtransferase